MGNQGFDHRYPALFQPGGETWATAELPSAAPAPSAGLVTSAPAPNDSDDALGSAPEVIPVTAADTQAHKPRWSARSWIIASTAVLVTFAGAVFCFLAVSFIPSSSTWATTNGPDVVANPWGYTILPGAPALATAALGMLAAAFVLSSRHYRSQWLRGAAALVGTVALVGGTIACFSTTLWPDLFYQPFQEQENVVPIQWTMMFQWATAPLLTVGLCILSVVAVVCPDGKPGGGVYSAKAAFVMGAALIAAALWAWFATSLYPLQSNGEAITTGDYESWTNPWPHAVAQAGGPLIMVGAGVLLWGVLILATSPPAAAPREESIEAGEES
ncbi:hypothetical protein MB46_14140 [Arthrobacter alpinus]|uniref:hypothetical protein n=1 Tax=Arthrobacter alpinus TaxID=656366 RepID=UPI0005C87863|nr:hypothetical protein [Arthrobacter alpinus]ALV46457.1 hypothetical protein MB46_14140 [Arthrobacter alpinus]